MSLISLQGAIRIGTRLVTGKPGPMYFCGNVPEATINLQSDSETVKESFSGSRLPYGTIDTGQSGTLNMTMNEVAGEEPRTRPVQRSGDSRSCRRGGRAVPAWLGGRRPGTPRQSVCD